MTTSNNIKFSEDQILHKLKTICDADKALKTDFTFLDAIGALSKIEDPKILEKEFNAIRAFNPIVVCRLNERLRFITDMATHQSGSTQPVLVACIKNAKQAGVFKLSKNENKSVLKSKIPTLELFKAALTRELQDDLYNDYEKFEEETIPVAAFADTKFIRTLYDPSPGLSGKDLHKSILNEMNQLLQIDESLSDSESFKNLFRIFAHQVTCSSSKVSSIKNSFQGEGIKEDQKHYKKTYQAVRDDFLLTNIPEETKTSELDHEQEETPSEDEENFTSSMPSSGRIPRKEAIRTQEESEPESPNDSDENSSSGDDDNDKEDDPLVHSSTSESNSGRININQSDIFSLLQMGAAAGTSRFTAYRNKITTETIRWIKAASQDKRGGNKLFSPQLESALENQHISGVADSFQWAMEEEYRGTGTCTLQESMLINIFQNKIAMNKVVSDLSEVTSGLSIAMMIPGNKTYTEKKGNVEIFIPSTAKELLDQIELFEAFLSVLFTKNSFVFKQCKNIRKQFEEHYQFLNSQFGKYESACGAHILKAIHNSFNTFFVKAKKDKNFKPHGIKLSLLDRLEEGEDLNLATQDRKRERNDNYNRSNKKGNRNNNNRDNNYNNNSNNNNNRDNNNNNNNSRDNYRDNRSGDRNNTSDFQTNWIYTGVFRDNFNPDSIKAFRTKVPSYDGKQLCLKRGLKGFCHKDCKLYHGAVSKTDAPFCKFVSDNNLPFKIRE